MRRTLASLLIIAALVTAATVASAAANIALGRPATASGTYTPSAAPFAAVDGDTTTAWNAGGYATQWIEIDLGSDKSVDMAHMKAAQFPPGAVTHVITGRTSDGATVTLATFSGYSEQGKWLTAYSADTTPVRYVRITTLASPSWVAWWEIELTEGSPPTPVATSSWGQLKALFR